MNVAEILNSVHASYVELNQKCFLAYPPDDEGTYVYTYYCVSHPDPQYAVYHGLTSDAKKRAKDHYAKAPWASWVQHVRYRRCSTVAQARRLESRLHRKVPSVCAAYGEHGGPNRTHWGEDWSEFDKSFPINHVTGSCFLEGGTCDLLGFRQQVAQHLVKKVQIANS